MKKIYAFQLIIFLFSCKNEDIKNTSGEISIQKMAAEKSFTLQSPKQVSTFAIIIRIQGRLKSDVKLRLYDIAGNSMNTERVISKGNYFSKEFRFDYYSTEDVILKVEPTKGSEETFKIRWMVAS